MIWKINRIYPPDQSPEHNTGHTSDATTAAVALPKNAEWRQPTRKEIAAIEDFDEIEALMQPEHCIGSAAIAAAQQREIRTHGLGDLHPPVKFGGLK